MNILYLLTSGLDIGGAQKDIVAFTQEFIKNGHEVTVICKGGSLKDAITKLGAKYYDIDFHFRSPLTLFKAIRLVKDIIRKENIDILAPQSIRTSIVTLFSNMKNKKPVVTTIHNVGSRFYSLISGLILNMTSTFVVFESEYERERLIKVGLNWNKTIVIHSGVDFEKFAPRPKEQSILKEINVNLNDFIIGNIARLSPEKGQKYLISAMKGIIKVFPGTKLIFIGDGRLKMSLKKQVRFLGLENCIKFVGEQNDIPRYLSIVDLFVLPSIRESFPLSAREAMAMGKPVIATKVGGCKEVVNNGVTGLLIPPADSRSLAQTIVSLIKDKQKLLGMGKSGRLKALNSFDQRQWLTSNEDIMLYFSQRISIRIPKINLRSLLSNLFYFFITLTKPEHGIRILMYHRVNNSYPADRLSVKVSEFRRQMDFLRRNNYEILTLEEAVEQLSAAGKNRTKNNKPKVVLTFDDGYMDNYANAYPVLKEYGLPATVFLTVNSIGKKDFLTWDQINKMAQNNITFGAHTLNHIELSRAFLEKAKHEISGSKEKIESEGIKCDFFCYPKGDFNQKIKRLVAKAAFKSACSVKPGGNVSGQDLFELRRTEISGFDSLFEFKKKVYGAFDCMHSLIQRRVKHQFSMDDTRLNVLYVIWSLGLGGAEQVVINLVRGLDKTKFNPLVCCLNDKGRFAEELEKEGIEIIALNKKGKFDIAVIFKLISVIKRYRIDILHTHLWGANFWGRIAAKLAGTKIIIATEHSSDTWKTGLHFIFDRLLSCWADKIIAVSGSVKEFYVKKVGIKSENIIIIPNGVDIKISPVTDYKVQLRKELGLDDGGITLAVIGRLVPEKGYRYFLLALKELLENYKIKGLIVGSGPLEKELKQFSRDLGLNGNAIFTGLRQDVPNLLEAIDILVLPSLREGLPMVILEAMAVGVPIVATRVGGIPEVIIDGETGFLIEPESHRAIGHAVSCLLEKKELRRHLIENAKKMVQENFSLKNMVSNTECLYGTLWEGKNRC